MKKLSKTEWVVVAIAVIFVGYTLFGGDVIKLFKNQSMSENNQAAAVESQNIGGVMIKDVVVGQGAEADSGKMLTVNYILALADGTVIQNSKDFGTPFKFTLGAGQVIQGWEQGFEGMKVGGTRIITIPPELGYGANAVGPIPANSTLVFTVELLEATQTTPELVQ